MAFKLSPSKAASVGFSPQQIAASEEMVENLTQGVVRYNILLAQMQSGKTETYLLTAWEMVRKTGKIENVVIFSGNSEIYLKGQLATTLRGSIFQDKYEAYLRSKGENAPEVLRELEKWAQFDSVQPKFQILWGTEMDKYRGPTKKTLFIWEESHYAQTMKQSPDKFLQKMGISADGDMTTFTKKDNYMISISATPFSELSDTHHLKQNKKVVFMLPGNGYNSVKRMRDNGKIKVYEDLTDGINQALSSAETTRKASYAIIRITSRTEGLTKEIIQQHNKTLSHRLRWQVFHFDSKTTGKEKEDGDRVWRDMASAPRGNIIILIRGKCRMGHDLSKNYLAFVMETSKSPKTDTILQGLLGRACGYPRALVPEEDNIYQVEVYLNEKIILSGEIDHYIDMIDTIHDGAIQVLPTKARNLAKFKAVTGVPIIPIRITRTVVSNDRPQIIQDVKKAFTTEQLIENKNSDKNYQEVREKFLKTFEDNQHGKFKVFYINDKKKRKTRATNAIGSVHQAFEQGFAQNFGSGLGIDAENTEFNIWVIEHAEGLDNTKIYVTSSVEYEPLMGGAITETNRKEVFACHISPELKVEANGGFTLFLPSESSHDVEVMLENLNEFIRLSLDPKRISTRHIRTLWDSLDKLDTGILLSQEVFDSLQKKGAIYERLKVSYGVELKLTRTRGRVEKSVKERGLVKLESISW